MKLCKKCNQHKPLGDFHKDKSKSDGYYSSCKLCNKQRRKINYHQNKEANIQAVRDWQLANPEKTAMYKKNNKYKRREVTDTSALRSADLLAWADKQLKICSYCGIGCKNDYQIDHIEPLSKGGAHELSNLTIACPTCNREKSDTSLLIWLINKATIRS